MDNVKEIALLVGLLCDEANISAEEIPRITLVRDLLDDAMRDPAGAESVRLVDAVARLYARRLFESLYCPEPNTGCWLWTGHVNISSGYGSIRFIRATLSAHRVSWEMYRGPIPEVSGPHGICVLHRCDVRSCVNPDHLFLGTQADNIADMDAKGRRGVNIRPAIAATIAAKRAITNCPHGHVYDDRNTKWRTDGTRGCRACHLIIQKRRRAAARVQP